VSLVIRKKKKKREKETETREKKGERRCGKENFGEEYVSFGKIKKDIIISFKS